MSPTSPCVTTLNITTLQNATIQLYKSTTLIKLKVKMASMQVHALLAQEIRVL
jgi:hypothetical protein